MATDLSLDLVQLGAVAVLFFFCIKEFFIYLKNKSHKSSGESNIFDKQILDQLTLMNNNHLSHIQGAIEEGNRAFTASMHDDNMKMIEILGEIKGLLSNR